MFNINFLYTILVLLSLIIPSLLSAQITNIKILGDPCTTLTLSLQAEGTSSSPYFSWNFGDPASGSNNTVTITGASFPPFPTHTFSSPGTYNVCVTFTDPGFSPTTICRTINIGPNNCCTASISGGNIICSGGNATLVASSGNSYLWSTGETTQSIVVTTPNTYSVSVTDFFGCTATASIVVTNAGLPSPNIGTGVSITFPGCTAIVSATSSTPGALYSWTGPATPPTATNPLVVIYSGTYTVTVTDPITGCSRTGSVTATFPNSFNVTANDATICPGDSAVLTATGGGSVYTWTPPDGLSATTGSSVTASPAVTTTYTVTSSVAGCFDYDLVTVTVANNIPASISGNLTFCAGGNTTLTANAGSSYLWSTGATTQSIVVNTAGTYGVTVSQGGSCPASSTSVNVTTSNINLSPIYHD